MHVTAQHLDALIRDVLDLARDEMGELRLVCEPLDVAKSWKRLQLWVNNWRVNMDWVGMRKYRPVCHWYGGIPPACGKWP